MPSGITGSIGEVKGSPCRAPMTDDGVRLHYEESGRGTPLIFVHEFAGDHRSYEAQFRHFGRRYHAIAFNARGYPPSDVPEAVSAYTQARAADDILAILDHIGAPEGPCRRHLDGCLRDPAFRPAPFTAAPCRCASAAAATAPSPNGRPCSAPRPTPPRRCCAATGWPPSPSATPSGRPGCSSRPRTRAVTPSSSGCWRSIRRSARPTRRPACRRSAPRSTI